MQITFAGRFNQATGLSLPYWNFTYLTTDEAYHGILLFYLIFSALLSFASAWIVSKLKQLLALSASRRPVHGGNLLSGR